MKKLAFSYVRYSSAPQAQGRSEDRQVEATEKYARENGFILDDSRRLVERATSASTGANVAPKAVFGGFLNDVRSGQIPRGSVLIVEAVDRITRLPAVKAMHFLEEILEAGIEIHTLKNGRVLTEASLTKSTDLLVCVLELCSAHDETAFRGTRVKDTWKNNKREASKDNPITARVPLWLRLNPETKRIEPIPERQKVVKDIFKKRLAGNGQRLIAKELNKAGIPPFGKAREWLSSYVRKILTNRAVLGEYQPYETINGKRVPDGNVKVDYFPQVINRDLFNDVQGKLKGGRIGGDGKHNGGVSNLFSGLLKCAYTTRKMWHTNKKSGTTWQYLTDLQGNVWKYNDFENSFFAWVKEVQWFKLLADQRSQLSVEAREKIETLLKEKEDLERRSNRITNAIEFSDEELSDLVAKKRELKGQLERNANDLQAAMGDEQKANTPTLTMREMEKAFLGDREKRLQLKAELHRHIQTIWVQPKERTFSVIFWSGKELHYSAKHKQGLTDWEALTEYIAN